MVAVRGARVPVPPTPIRTVRDRDMSWWVLAGWFLRGVGLLVAYLVRLWWLTIPTALLAFVWLSLGWTVLVALVLVVVLASVAWWRTYPESWLRWVAHPYAGRVRLWVVYRRHWIAATLACGLAPHLHGARHIPRILRVRSNRWCDQLTVRLCDGQTPADWTAAAERLAHTFRVPDASVRSGRRPGRIVLVLRRRDPLATVVRPLPVPSRVDLNRLALGRTETGETYRLRLTGEHLLIAGATGAGKGSVIYSLLSALAPAIRAGLVQVWAFDPKGGMELAFAAPLFHRFSYGSPEAMADTLDQLVKEMQARADRLRGVTRQHRPSLAEPLIVVLVDELASLTAYVTDRKLRDRLQAAFSLLLSQGRAVGVHVIAALQDPRKEVLPFRDLFSTRIALRLTEPDQVRLVLSDTARELGAACDRIDHTTPGVAFVQLDGTPEPVRVRFAYHTDPDIHALAHTHQPTTGGGMP